MHIRQKSLTCNLKEEIFVVDDVELEEILKLVSDKKLKIKDVAGFSVKNKGCGCRANKSKTLSLLSDSDEEVITCILSRYY